MSLDNTYLTGKKKAYRLAKKVQTHCLAYRKFLQQKGIGKIDLPFERLPVTDKFNYINAYPLEDRLYTGKTISDFYMVCSSTGSTGEPTIWPRDYYFDNSLIRPHTEFLEEHFQILHKRSLVIIALGLGSSQAGIMHLKAAWGAHTKAKITVISPNGDAEMTVYLLEKLYSQYDQVICLGYPPTITDFINLAMQKNINMKKWNMKIGITGESVSSSWRREVIEHMEGKGEDFVSWYGSTEAGMIGFETKEINEVIQLALIHDDFRKVLFGTYNLPTFVGVDYNQRFIEIVDNEIIITADQVVPLVRYNSHDKGRLISGNQIISVLNKFKFHIPGVIPEETVYLAAYGRNFAEKTFSIEDIRYILDKIHIYSKFSNEFQYNENMKDRIIEVTIILYKKTRVIPVKLTTLIKARFNEELQKIITVKKKIIINLIIKDIEKAKGYKYGKLRYLLNS